MATTKKKTTTKKTTAKKETKPKAKKEVKKTTKKTTKATKATKATKTASKKKAAKKSEVDLSNLSKQEIIDSFATKEGDTGSPEVQIALSTQKIVNLTKHLKENPKDNHSRRGLLKIIAKRRRILHYLQEMDEARGEELTNKLGLKK